MNSTEVLSQFRSDISDIEEPHLWSDEEAYRYLDDAQKMFCRLTGGLGDASSELTQLSYAAGDDWITTSPLILKLRDATHAANGREVDIVNMEDMRKHGWRFDGKTGTVCRLVIGLEPGRARLHPIPREDGMIQLIIDRLPLVTITDAGDQDLEVQEQHHMHLIMWMMHLAYSKQDAETFDRKKAAEHKFNFEQYCFEAKAERERALTKTRVVSYGGI